ncbi:MULTISPECIES: bacterioferritin [Gammaproteobacteria]|uniref:bacterioferritin n=1 Tax=Gammaproteobacteria TaxID=1236 RepID=UPI000DCFEAAB|nr:MULTISPECIES: bacterioferritin [Gammaproteobacteria]RTE87758.1 bacterioferritin [Aliidiomarina sp. B3213]TCZ92460.1 bacterioferritin [Lysobacter sp. N42]
MSKVIDALNKLLRWELTSIDQYTRNASIYEDWGFTKLHERIAHEADDERGHAKMLIDRILLLGGKPDLETRHPLPPSTDVPTMLKGDLDLELQNAKDLKASILLCESEKDFVSRSILVSILKDTEEDHAYWLRQQIGLIEIIGLENYLQSQM